MRYSRATRKMIPRIIPMRLKMISAILSRIVMIPSRSGLAIIARMIMTRRNRIMVNIYVVMLYVV